MTQSSDTRHDGTSDRGQTALVSLVLVLLLMIPAPTAVAQDAPPPDRTERPLTVGEIVEFESLAAGSPIRLSPDGGRVAYTVAGAQRPLESVLELVKDSARASAGIRVADLETGQIFDLTPGANSWAPAWSPDGSTLAFYSTRSGDPRLWTWSPNDGLRRAADAPVWPAFMDQAPRWADGRTVVVKLLPEDQSVGETARRAVPAPPELQGHEGTTVQLIQGQGPDRAADAFPEWIRWAYGGDLAAIDVRSGSVTRLADDQLAMWWDISPDGSILAFSSMAGVEDERVGFNLNAVPLAGGVIRALPGRLARPFGDGVSWSPSGDRLAYVSGNGVYVVHMRDGKRIRIADARGGWAEAPGPVWTRDGQTLVFTDGDLWRLSLEGDGGPERIAAFDGRQIHTVVTGPERVPARNGAGDWLLRVSDDATGETGFARVDPSTGTRSAERLQPGTMSASLRLAATGDGGRVVVSYADATRAPELWLLGADLSPARQVSRMNPAFDSVALGETRQVTWTTRTGDTAHGTVTLPPGFRGDAPVPLLVEVYGGSRVGASPHTFDRYRQLFATHGYAVLVPGIPLEVGTPMSGHADAVLPGLDRLIEDGIADPERMGVFGHSYGGYGTLALLVQTDRFSAAVASAAQGNMAGAFGQLAEDGIGRTWWAERGQGRMGTTPWSDPQRYVENSPVFYLDRVRAPLLLLHGADDRGVPPYLAGEIFVGLQHLGRTVTLARYAGEGHTWAAWRTPNKVDYWQRTLDWFDEHLGGVNGPLRSPDTEGIGGPQTPADTLMHPGPAVGVSPPGGVPAVEPTLAVDPRDPDRMVAAAMTFPDAVEGPVVRTWWTADGGMSWAPGALDPAAARGADPMLAWAPDGRIHLFHLGRAHHVSEDGGRTWLAAPPLPEGTWDYPQVAVDRSGGSHHGRIYLWVAGSRRGDDGRRLYPLTLLRSDRSGQHFRIHRELLPGDVNYQVAGVVARQDGSLVASFHEIDRAGEYLRVPRLWTVPFEPGGEGEAVPALAQRRFVAESPALASVPGGDVAMTWTGLPSGEPGTEGRIAVARSEDGGLTWSEPVTVDPIPAGAYLPHHGMLAATPGGGLLLTWQRPTPALGERCFQLHAAWSGPGTETFTTPVPVAPEGSCGTAGGNERPVGGEGTAPVSRRFGDGGDYHGLVALPDGTFQVLWSDAREGAYRVWTARVAPPAANPERVGGL